MSKVDSIIYVRKPHTIQAEICPLGNPSQDPEGFYCTGIADAGKFITGVYDYLESAWGTREAKEFIGHHWIESSDVKHAVKRTEPDADKEMVTFIDLTGNAWDK